MDGRWKGRSLAVIFKDMEKSFLGRGWGFPPEFDRETGQVRMVTEEEDICQSLGILLSTAPGERIHRFDFGCGIRQFVYEPMTLTTQTIMRNMIEKAVLMYEPRISLERITFDMAREAEGIMEIVLDYVVLKTNRRSNMVYPFYLREGTDIEK